MKLKQTFLLMMVFMLSGSLVFGQLSSSATYSLGDIEADADFDNATGASTCPGALTVTIPIGATVLGVDVSYDFEAVAGSGAYKSYQLSELRCVSPGGVNEGVLASFPNDWTSGVLTYERTGLTIADGVEGGGDILFELHAGNTKYGAEGCSAEFEKINNNTWTVTVFFLDPSYPDLPSNPAPADSESDVLVTVGALTWDFGANTENYDLYFGTENPPTTLVVNNEVSGENGSYATGTLMGSSNYYWQVICRNSAKNEIAGPVWSFSTECLPIDIPLVEDFDELDVPQWSSPHFINPTCWTLLYECSEGYANQGVYMSTEAFTAPNCWMATNEADGEAWNMMILPEFSEPISNLQLSFMAKANYLENPLKIGTMSDPTDAETFTEFTTINPGLNAYEEFEIPFTAYTGDDTYIAVRYEAQGPNTWNYLYIDNVIVGQVPTCPKPRDLTLIEATPNTAEVSWLEQGSATQWNIEVVLSGENPTGTPTATITENPYLITDLEPETLYDFYIQSDCGGGDLSLWSSPGSFLTACLPVAAPVFENFDASTELPNCWSTIGTTGGSWQMQTYSAYSAPNIFKMRAATLDDAIILISPALDADLSTVQINFVSKRGYNEQNIYVGTISNPNDYTSFTPIASIDLSTAYTEYEVWLNNYSGTDSYIAFKCGDISTYTDVYLDDINIGLLPSCLYPIDLNVTEVTESTARINFSESLAATTWEIELGTTGFEPGTGSELQSYIYELTGDDYSYVMTGLETGTFYDVSMRAICGEGDTSMWSPNYSFMSQLGLYSPLPMIETFDPDFTYSGNIPTNSMDWALNTDFFVSETNSAWNDYSGESESILLLTRRFDLSERSNALLSFWHIAKTEGNKDHCYVEISLDGGSSFEIIPISAYFGNGNYYEASQNNPEGPAFDEDSYTDWGTGNQTPENSWWKQETFDLSAYSGNDNVVIRFRLVSDKYGDRYGWLLDDVTVDNYNGTEMLVTPETIDVEVEPAGYTSETLTIANNGDFPIIFNASVQDYSDAMTTLISEDFEAGIPEDWTVLNEGTSNGSMWTWTDPAVGGSDLNGTNYMYVGRNYPDTCSESLISPMFDGTGYANVLLNMDKVWAKGSSSKPDFTEISVWDGAEWQSIEHMKTVNIGSWGTPDQTQYDITQYANANMQIRVYYYGYSYSKVGVDNIVVTASDIPVNWLTLDGETSVSGLVQGGESLDIEVGFMAKSTFALNTWHSAIQVTSNDLVNSPAIVPVSMTVDCINPWDVNYTGQVHSISIPLEVAPEIFGEPLEDMDWIGVFYTDDNGELACGGAVQWNGMDNLALNAFGDDPTTDEKDGFATGEAFSWIVKRCGSLEQFDAMAVYDPTMPNQGNFADFGLSKLVSLSGAYFQNYTLTQGWNSMSTYLVPVDAAVENMFAPVVNELTILRNLSSLYWPAESLNTIGNWDNNSGYVVKVSENLDFVIAGESFAGTEVTIPTDWSYLPVVSTCPVNIMDMFGDNLENVIIIQELIGTKVFWPTMEVYTLETLEPGKAYNIKLVAPMLVSFPECMDKAQTTPSTQVNNIETTWGTINMTPVSEQVVFTADAQAQLLKGDVIGAFGQDGNIYGSATISNPAHNTSISLFGDDATSMQKDGFDLNETVSYKLLRASGEQFDLEVEYSTELDNTTGTFIAGSFAAIENFKMTATAIGEEFNASVEMYPNPASDLLNIKGINTSTELTIFNVFGEEVYRQELSSSTAVNVSSYAKGTYVVKITTSAGDSFKKLVIQ